MRKRGLSTESAEVINYQAKRLAREKAELQVQEDKEEREAKRLNKHEEKVEPGVDYSVEHLEFIRGKPGNAAKLEKYEDDYYYGLHCSNVVHPEAIEHHAGEVIDTWYDWLTNELICPADYLQS